MKKLPIGYGNMIRKYKRLPYGNSNFEKVITEGYVYIDKTRYIEELEREDNAYLFFTRPRKFGKSLFFSMLSHYYAVSISPTTSR
jgi:hypothetical protein